MINDNNSTSDPVGEQGKAAKLLLVADSLDVQQQYYIKRLLHSLDRGKYVSLSVEYERIKSVAENWHPDICLLCTQCEFSDLDVLKSILYQYPDLPVLVLAESSLKTATYASSIKVVGASGFVEYPAEGQDVHDFLIRLVQAFEEILKFKQGLHDTKPSHIEISSSRPQAPRRFGRKADIVVIGVSAGGPQTLPILLSSLPGNLRAPVLIVQHIPESFSNQLAISLDGITELSVREAFDGAPVAGGDVWVAKGDYHLQVVEDGNTGEVVLALDKGPRIHSVRPAADYLFYSAADLYGPNTLGIVLTGMGFDGLNGCRRLKEVGAEVVVQDERTAVVWGMAGAVSKAGLADKTLPIEEIADEVIVRSGLMT